MGGGGTVTVGLDLGFSRIEIMGHKVFPSYLRYPSGAPRYTKVYSNFHV